MRELSLTLVVSILLNYIFVILEIWKTRKIESEIKYLKQEHDFFRDRLCRYEYRNKNDL